MLRFGSPCCCGCVFVKDNFNRADSTTIGGDWTEVAGSWEILDNELTTSSSNALLNNNYVVEYPLLSFRYQYPWVRFNFKAGEGDCIRLMRSHDDNPYEPQTITEIEVGSDAKARAITIASASTTEVIQWEFDVACAADEWHTFELKLRGGIASLFIDDELVHSSFFLSGPINSLAKKKLCLATGSISGPVYFDDFYLEHYITTEGSSSDPFKKCPSCPAIAVWPPGCNPPSELYLEISGLTDPFNYIGLNGTYTLTQVGTGPDYMVDGLNIPRRTAFPGDPDFVDRIVFNTQFIADFRFLECLTNDYGVSFVSFYLPSYSYSNDTADYQNFMDKTTLELRQYSSGSAIAVLTVP